MQGKIVQKTSVIFAICRQKLNGHFPYFTAHFRIYVVYIVDFTVFLPQVLSTRKPFFNQYHYNKISIGPRDVENIKLDETSLMVMIDTKYRQLDNVLLKFQTMVSSDYYVI